MNNNRFFLCGSALVVAVVPLILVCTSTVLTDAVNLAFSGQVAKAAHVVRLWAGQWSASDKIKLAQLYAPSGSIRHDRSEAISWYRKAAEQGSPEAEQILGLIYLNGTGVAVDTDLALKWLRKSAAHGYIPAMINIASIYQDGTGVPKSDTDAFVWYQKAGEEGDAGAQLMTGLAYFQGKGTSVDYSEAVTWLRKSADQGNAGAEYMLSTMYTSGTGVPQDSIRGRQLLEQAADKGYPMAEFSIGSMYFNGEGGERDRKKANEFFLKSAAQGNSDAQEVLGQIYNAGEYELGIKPNKVIAYAFFNLAAAQNNAKAATEKAALSEWLTPEEIAKGQSLASNWKSSDQLPFKTTLEDIAPQDVFRVLLSRPLAGDATFPDLIKSTSIWFSRDFTVARTKYRSVFLATKGEECHACGANISVATYRYTDGKVLELQKAQPNIGTLGTFGNVPPPKDPAASIDSDSRVEVGVYRLGEDKLAMTTEQTFSGQGETDTTERIFVFEKGAWRTAGQVLTSDSQIDDCRNANIGDVQSSKDRPFCRSWSGKIQIDNDKKKDWPDFVVKASGTDVDYKVTPTKLINAVDTRYEYDGKEYVLSAPKK